MYSVVPRSSQWPSISILAAGLALSQAEFSRSAARACSLNSYLSKAKKISLSGPVSGVLPWRCASKLDPEASPWDTEALALDFDVVGDDLDKDEVDPCGLVLSAVLEAQPVSENATMASTIAIRGHVKFVSISNLLASIFQLRADVFVEPMRFLYAIGLDVKLKSYF